MPFCQQPRQTGSLRAACDLAQSRTTAAAKVHRAQILLCYSQGETVSAIATLLRTNRPKD
jgi:hypothetical protein